MNKFLLGYKVLRELGIKQALLYALYRFGIMTGHYRRVLSTIQKQPNIPHVPAQVKLPGYLSQTNLDSGRTNQGSDEIDALVLTEFNRILTGIRTDFPGRQHDWSRWLSQPEAENVEDIRLLWEDARLGWAVDLAHLLLQQGKLISPSVKNTIIEAFWDKLSEFDLNNPAYYGLNWISAQEAAIRILHLAYAWSVFGNDGTTSQDHAHLIARVIHKHANRIPVTLVYARAQNNNHLLSEAAGLITATIMLPHAPEASHWFETGWRWFETGIVDQIADTGEYNQHSATYHRMMLTLALWMNANRQGRSWPSKTMERLQKASCWYLDLLIDNSFDLPFFGSDDSSRVMLPTGLDVKLFLQDLKTTFAQDPAKQPAQAGLIQMRSGNTRGYLRVGKFTSRPSHADQLHFDLWYDHENVLVDPGTYSYNRKAPWQNPFATSAVHNTILVDGRDQMTRAGKFLWLDWAQADVVEMQPIRDGQLISVKARHNGYHNVGVMHQRQVSVLGQNEWSIDDTLTNKHVGISHTARLQWNIPEWKWELDGDSLRCTGEGLELQLKICSPTEMRYSIISAGKTILGDHVAQPWEGWLSSLYGEKHPGLLFIAETEFNNDLRMITEVSVQPTS